MGLDDDDTPVGEIVALVLIVAIVILILIVTFESCVDFEQGYLYKICEEFTIDVGPKLGEEIPCFNDVGEVEFSVLNRATFPIEGIAVHYGDVEINISRKMSAISQDNFKVDFGLRIGQTFTHINVTPIIYDDSTERNVLCDRSTQKINRLKRCGVQSN